MVIGIFEVISVLFKVWCYLEDVLILNLGVVIDIYGYLMFFCKRNIK